MERKLCFAFPRHWTLPCTRLQMVLAQIGMLIIRTQPPELHRSKPQNNTKMVIQSFARPVVLGGSPTHRAPKLFGRERPLHDALGGRNAADIILWRKKTVSASILAAATAAWALFEVEEYHFLTLACYAAIIGMLIFFIWTNASAFVNLPVPRIPETVLSDFTTMQVIQGFHRRLTWIVYSLYDIACGKDIKLFILTVLSLYIGSLIASCFSSLTLLYLLVLCTMTVPALYEQYESEVDHLVARGVHDLRSHFAEMDSGVLRKIPRGKGAVVKN